MFEFLDLPTLSSRAPALLVARSMHEYAHAAVSDAMGDPTPSRMGRLTINPMAHLDMMGTLLLVLCGFGWAKPVDIDPRYYKNYRMGMLKVSFAGPGMNLFLAFLSLLLITILGRIGMLGDGGFYFLQWIMMYNVWFAFFNLIPIPPLDGSKIVSTVLPGELAWKFENFNARYGFVILMLIVFSGWVNRIIGPLAQGYVNLCYAALRVVF